MKYLFILAMLFQSYTNIAQQLPDFTKIRVSDKEDFTPEANNAALQAANFLLSASPKEIEKNNKVASGFLIAWMTNTPDHTFEIDQSLMGMTDDNQDLMVTMMAGMAQYVLQNKAATNNADGMRLYTAKKMIQYANAPANNIKPGKNLRKAMEAEKSGTLNAYLIKAKGKQ